MKMKHLIKSSAYLSLVTIASVFTGCNEENDLSWAEERENAIQEIATVYVNKTVAPTYRNLADNAIELADLCSQIEASVRKNIGTDVQASGTLSNETQTLITQACEKWYGARKYWELSEAWLFGAAADYYIDPHIDSWPLDATELDQLLNDATCKPMRLLSKESPAPLRTNVSKNVCTSRLSPKTCGTNVYAWMPHGPE